MNSRRLAVLALVAVVIAGAVFFISKKSAPQQISSAEEAPVAEQNPAPESVPSAAQPPAQAVIQQNRPGAAPEDPEFQKFLEREAKHVDATHVDSAQKKREIADVVSKLTPAQARQLLQTAKSPGSSAGERILSAYLMVEAGPRAESELRQLITSPLNYPGAQPVHSANEALSMQERSVRIMALEGLISRATHEPSARDALGKTIPDIPDPYIKSYAQKRLSEIKAH